MIKSFFILLLVVFANSLSAVTETFRDDRGDITSDDDALKSLDIRSVRVRTTDKKHINFEVRMQSSPIAVDSEDQIYFIVAVNTDGDFRTGAGWTAGQDFAANLNINKDGLGTVHTWKGDPKGIKSVSIEEDTLRFTLILDEDTPDQITFCINTMRLVRGEKPIVLDTSVNREDGEYYNLLEL